MCIATRGRTKSVGANAPIWLDGAQCTTSSGRYICKAEMYTIHSSLPSTLFLPDQLSFNTPPSGGMEGKN